MSSAVYPLGMVSYNNRLPTGGYRPQKTDIGLFKNPLGNTAGNTRPLTNRDPLNSAIYKAGLARPIKHFRGGRNIPVAVPLEASGSAPETDIDGNVVAENIYYSQGRYVKSSTMGSNMIAQMQDQPGRFLIKPNTSDTTNTELVDNCTNCKGIAITSSYKPTTNQTEKPQPYSLPCCNQQKKALKRVRPASTNLKKNYYTNISDYLYNRCQTYEQRAFNFYESGEPVKAGSPLSVGNFYTANCTPNGEITQSVVNALIAEISGVLYTNGLITQEQLAEATQFVTFVSLFAFLGGISAAALAEAERLLGIALLNPETSDIISPTNPKGCKLVVYKPNNYQFAVQGAVESSTQLLKKKVATIESNAASLNKVNKGYALFVEEELTGGISPFVPFMLKYKTPILPMGCDPKRGCVRVPTV